MHRNLDDLLRERMVPELPSNLAYRIIAAAKPRGEERGFTWAAVQRMLDEIFVIPQPALAMAVMLILGITAGAYYMREDVLETRMAQANFSSFITAELSVDYGEFL